MHLHRIQSSESIKWIGGPELNSEEKLFYNSCEYSGQTYNVNDFVLIHNYRHDFTYCGQLKHLYEIKGASEDPHRAIVQWYTRPLELPAALISDENYKWDFEREVIQDFREYITEIQIKTILGRCHIMHESNPHLTALDTIGNAQQPIETYACRYKLIRKNGKGYKLLPLNENFEELPKTPKRSDYDRKVDKLKLSKTPGSHNKYVIIAPSSTNTVVTNNNILTPQKADNKLIDDDYNVSPARRSLRKRSERHMILDVSDETINYSTPKKTRRYTIDYATPKSAIPKERRRSILKTPGAISNPNTPKRNIQMSGIVEEYNFHNKTPTLKRLPKHDDNSDHDYIPTTPKSKRNQNIGTPKSESKRKQLREGVITPKQAKREMNVSYRKSDVQVIRENLHVSSAPNCLPCREMEYKNIYSFLEGKIIDESGGCMYISGIPGTGKTATVTEVIGKLKQEAKLSNIPNFEFIEINGLRLTDPQQTYVQIYRQLTGKTVAWKQAYTHLQKRFLSASSKRLPTVLLIDELDIICNRRQDVVYNLLDWSTKNAAKLAVVTIANTMNLPERFLQGKITSRLGLTRLTFMPYTFKQLEEIVKNRLIGSNQFRSEAIQLVTRKIAAVSGDARRALDICRRATEIAQESTECVKSDLHVTLVHVQQALSEMISSGKILAIKQCSKLEQLFLQAVSAEVARTGVEEISFLGVYTQLGSLAVVSGISAPPTGQMLKICTKLNEQRLLICEPSKSDLYRKILLNVSSDDIHFALQPDLLN